MTDATTRRTQRNAVTGDPEAQRQALVAHMRTWQHVPTTCTHCDRVASRLEVCCPKAPHPLRGKPPYYACDECDMTGRTPWEWPDRLALAAYAGDPAARELAERYACDVCTLTAVHDVTVDTRVDWGACVDSLSLREWLAGLSRWPGAPLIAALGAAWAWLRTLECAHGGEDEHGCWDCKNTGYDNAEGQLAEAALTAATEHARCGCEASREAWDEALDGLRNEDAPLGRVREALWIPWIGDRFEECPRHLASPARLGEPATRAAVQDALVGRALRGEILAN